MLNNSQEGRVGEKPPSYESYSSMIVVGEREREREEAFAIPAKDYCMKVQMVMKLHFDVQDDIKMVLVIFIPHVVHEVASFPVHQWIKQSA